VSVYRCVGSSMCRCVGESVCLCIVVSVCRCVGGSVCRRAVTDGSGEQPMHRRSTEVLCTVALIEFDCGFQSQSHRPTMSCPALPRPASVVL